MTIYLFDRKIKLKRERGNSENCFPANSLEEVALLWKKFESDPDLKVMTLWSADYTQLKKNFSSLFTRVNAAGGIVRNEKNETLFIFRRGKWDLPKGKFCRASQMPANGKKGCKNGRETPEEAAIREVREETGLKALVILRKLKKTFHIYYEKKDIMLKKTWWFEMAADSWDELVPEAAEQITEVRWVQQSQVYEKIRETYPSLRKLFRN